MTLSGNLLVLLFTSWVFQEVSSDPSVRGDQAPVEHFMFHRRERGNMGMAAYEWKSRDRVADRRQMRPPYSETIQKEVERLKAEKEDLGVRFSKIDFVDNTTDTSRLPLTVDDYPLDFDTAKWLSTSQCPSIVIPENCDECNLDFAMLVEKVGGPPLHPANNTASPYWDEVREVHRVREQRLNGTDPKCVMPMPDIWEDFDIEEVAEAVHDEFPGIYHVELIKSLMKNGTKVDGTIIPLRCKVEFLRGPVMLSDLNTWSIGMVGPHNFGVKYFVGRARPEEVAYMISERTLNAEHGVPDDILAMIPEGSLKYAVNYTSYSEGSPKHPSWPAMHSAASSASLWLAVVLNLTSDQWCQAKLVDYGVAYARTVAAVHFPKDNTAGLNLGQEILAHYLPRHLAAKYGSDPRAVREKIASLRFDWEDFLNTDCAKQFRAPASSCP